MNRESRIVAALLVLALTITPQPAQSAPARSGPPTPDYTATAARHTPTVHTASTAVLSVTVRSGDTYGRWATLHCGTFTAWPAIQAANGWPERAIPVGKTALIACYGHTDAPPAPAQTATWVHPLASGTKVQNSRNCFRTSSRPGHGGADIRQPSGTPIRSVAAGIVQYKGFEGGGAGHYLRIRHAGNVFSQYHHLNARSPLAVGAQVSAGQTIGQVGRTGNATGPHLHLEIRAGGTSSGNRVNPAEFMRARGINIGC